MFNSKRRRLNNFRNLLLSTLYKVKLIIKINEH